MSKLEGDLPPTLPDRLDLLVAVQHGRPVLRPADVHGEVPLRLVRQALASRRANRLLVNRETLVAGTLLGSLAQEPPAPWAKLTEVQRALFDREAAELREPWAASFTSSERFTSWG